MKIYSLGLACLYSCVSLSMQDLSLPTFHVDRSIAPEELAGHVITYLNGKEEQTFPITCQELAFLGQSKNIAGIIDSVKSCFGIDKPTITLPIVSTQEYEDIFMPYLHKIYLIENKKQKKKNMILELDNRNRELLLKLTHYAHYFDIPRLERYAARALSKKLTDDEGISSFFNDPSYYEQISTIAPHLSSSLVSNIVKGKEVMLQRLFFKKYSKPILKKTLQSQDFTYDLTFSSDDSLVSMPCEKIRYSSTKKNFYVWNSEYKRLTIETHEKHSVKISFLPDCKPISGRSIILLDDTYYEPSKIFYAASFSSILYKDAKTDKQKFLKTISGKSAQISSLAINPAKEFIACSDTSKKIYVWSYDGTSIRTWLKDTDLSPNMGNLQLAFHPNKNILASGCRELRLWNLDDGLWECGAEKIRDIAIVIFSPDGTLLVASCVGKIYVSKVKSLQKCWELKGHAKAISCLTFSNDSSLLASGASDDTVRLWNPRHGSCIKTINCNNAPSAIVFNLKDTLVAVGFCDDRKIRLHTLDEFKKFLEGSRRLTVPQILLLLGLNKHIRGGASFNSNDKNYAHLKVCYDSLSDMQEFLGEKK